MAGPVAQQFHQAAELNRNDPRRKGNLVTLAEGTDVVVAGDLHGNRSALAKIFSAADLGAHPSRRLVLQEIVHGPPDPRCGKDRSIEPLLRAARAKVELPEQVLFLLGNHDVAQVSGSEITKEGHRVCLEFLEGVRYAYGESAEEILDAICDFLRSLPLAIRCPGGTLLAHSLPSPNRAAMGGTEILARPYEEADFRRGGPVYEWTWGRSQTPEQLDELAQELNVSYFVLGHRHTAMGWEAIAPRAVTIASDHEHGVIVHFRADDALDAESVASHVLPINALGRLE